MNYDESSSILEEIKKADSILLNCHRSPDPDSVGSVVAMCDILRQLGKKTKIVCVDDLSSDLMFLLDDTNRVEKINYAEFDFTKYDLFLNLDSSDWSQVSGNKDIRIPNIKMIVIDHHFTNDGFGSINLVDPSRSSTAEVLFKIFEDWGLEITGQISHALLSGLIYDTSSLQNPSADTDTAHIYYKLMKNGADKDEIIKNIYRSINFEKLKAISVILSKFNIDKENRFVWTALSYEDYKCFVDVQGVKTMVANLFGSSIDLTDFGVVMIEEQKNSLNISLRGRTDFDTSKIAEEIGGGGHQKASAARINGLPFNEAVEKVLSACKKYANKKS